MLPTIAFACAPQSISEIAVRGIEVFLTTFTSGVVLLAPILALVLYLIPRYRVWGLVWIVKVSIAVVAGLSLFVLLSLYTYSFIDNYVSTVQTSDGSEEEVSSWNPLCG